jgi:hypothetical protein
MPWFITYKLHFFFDKNDSKKLFIYFFMVVFYLSCNDDSLFSLLVLEGVDKPPVEITFSSERPVDRRSKRLG